MIPYFTGQPELEAEENHVVWPRRPTSHSHSSSCSPHSEGYDSFEEERAAHLEAQRNANSSASLNSFPDINPIQSFYLSKRHITSGNPTPLPTTLPKITPWRLRDKLKMVNGILLLCLNLDVDPPDVVKTQPSAVLECWVDPHSLPSNKAIEAIGTNLQHQFEALNPRMKYKPLLDPSVDDARKFCMNLRKLAQDERCLFYYNGHGVPKPTASGELWVFNKSYSQYIPVSLWDLQNWLGAPCIYVWDTSSAGYLLSNFVRVAEQRDAELKAQHGGVFPEGVAPYAESLQLAGCLADEQLPMCPDLPADLFTSCLTSPIETAMRWFLLKSGNLPTGITIDMIMQIPGDLKDRRTPLGELNWIFTGVTDTIAWTTFPRETFKKLFRQDLLVAALFRNFLLAERIMKNYHCTPHTWPPLPPTNTHPMWASWDLAIDACVAQLPRLLGLRNSDGETIAEPDKSLADPYQYIPSSFFSDSLTAFDVWLSRGGCALTKRSRLDVDADAHPTHPPYAEIDPLAIPVTCDATYKHDLVPRKPPDQLPIVLQVLLSQGHRLRALISFAQFCDLGPWAVNLALIIGIFPYMLKLLLAPPGDLRPVLIFIWARIVAVDPSAQSDLYSNHVYKYFAQVLSTREEPKFLLIPNASEHRAMCAFVLTSIARGMPEGQRALVKEGVLDTCLSKLEENDFLLRQWIVLCVAQIWAENDEIRDLAIGKDAPQLLMGQLGEEQAPDVRAALLYAISTFLGTSGTVDVNSRGGGGAGSLPSVSEKGHYRIEAGVSTSAVLAVKEDGSPMVRKELVVLISSVVREWRGHFVVCAWIYWEEDRRARASKQGGKVPDDLVSDAIAQWRAGLGMDEWWVETCHQVLSGYFTLFATLLELSIDPYPEVSSCAKTVVDYIMALLLESPFMHLQSSSLSLPPQPSRSLSSYGYSSRSRVTSLQPAPSLNPLAPSSPTQRGIPLSRTDTTTSATSRVTSTLKRTSSFANVLKSLGGYAFTASDEGSPAVNARQRPSDRLSRPPSPNYNAQQYISPYTAEGTTSRRSSPPLSPGRSNAPSPDSDISPVHIMEALIEEDMDRLRARREGAPRRFQETDERVFTSEHDDVRVPLGLGTGADLPDVLPLKSRFYDWCNEYFTEPQMRQVESHEPGSTTYNTQLWRRSRNEKIIGETQTQAEIAPHCEWDRPVSTLHVTGTPSKVGLHAFDTLLVSANDHDSISIWDWAQRRPLGVFSNNNPPSSTITSLRFINDDTDGLVVAGSSDGVVRIYRLCSEPLDGIPVQMVSAFRAMPSLVSIKRGPGLVLDWSQAAGAFAIGGDSRDIVIWDASSETKIDTISTQANSPLTALVADSAICPIVVAGFADGAVKAYDRRIRDAEAVVRTYREHSSWIVGARCQKGSGKDLITASNDGEVHLWDSRYATKSVMNWRLHDRLATFDLHNQAGVFATTSAVTPTHWRSHTTLVHSLPPSQPAVLSRVHHSTGLHHGPSPHTSQYAAAHTSLVFHPNEMLYAVGVADGTIRLLGCKLQERREQVTGGITRPYELPQPKALFETMSVSAAQSNQSFA
ncbi:hypothetical protein JB92DRAFT_3007752 [Gautieria morchelliformis]|nr:hypothetical protein JB92DRAFT_3007752 [Gautieria morchelliformis]